jgi:endonuclease/exonuclease/phosphatase (EEP) superfamily protein YafD
VDGTADWIVAQDPDVVVIEEARPAIRKAMMARKAWHVECPPDCPVVIFSKARPLASEYRQPAEDGSYLAMARSTFAAPGGGTYSVIGAHFTWPTMPRLYRAQGRRLRHGIDLVSADRAIVVGDFNSTPWSFIRRAEDKAIGLERRDRALATWPAGQFSRLRLKWPFPFLAIDHVYAGKAWRTVSVTRGPRLGSDHYPVVVRLALADEPPAPRRKAR